MKKVMVFLEGESELIFLYYLLFKVFNPDTTKIDSIKLVADNNIENVNKYNLPCKNPSVWFTLIQVGGDDKVLSQLKSNAKTMLSNGNIVCGLRDLYCKQYDEISGNKIVNRVSNKIIKKNLDIIKSISNSKNLQLFFSIMEIESWYLAFYKTLDRMGLITTDINRILKLKLQEIDPEKQFFKPKSVIKKIYEKIKSKPYKETKFSYSISKKITEEDIIEVISSGKIKAFVKFYDFLHTI